MNAQPRRDVGTIRVGRSKTDAGVRLVNLEPALQDELSAWKARARFGGSADYVFATATGKRQEKDNVRERILKRSVEKANEQLERDERTPLLAGGPRTLSGGRLRRSF